MTVFNTAFNNLIGWEGGYTNDPRDPGGPTNLGVIQTEYNEYRAKKGLRPQSVEHITTAEAEEIYRTGYWAPNRSDELNPGVANSLFDSSVNSGDRRGAEWLQKAINTVSRHHVVDVDGHITDATVKAANKLPPNSVIDVMLADRLGFMRVARHPGTGKNLWTSFGRGWEARIKGVRDQSHELAATAPSPSLARQP
jgi:lysozyme family protein